LQKLKKKENKRKLKKKKHILSKFPVLFSEGEKKIAKKLKILIKNRQRSSQLLTM
jgi:hypothetical protein